MQNVSGRQRDSGGESNGSRARASPLPPSWRPIQGQSAPVTFVLVEEQTAIREALAVALGMDGSCRCCGQAGDPGGALSAVLESGPSVLVTDIDLADGNGLDLIKVMKIRFPQIHLLVLSIYDESVYAELTLQAGALGYVMMTEPLEQVLLAIRTVAEGKVYLSPRMVSRLLQKRVAGHAPCAQVGIEMLSPRELQVLHLFGQWCSTKQIATKLNLSVKTVSYYRDRIREKLGFSDSAGLMRFATGWAEESAHSGAAHHAPPTIP